MPWLADRSPTPRISASSRGEQRGDLLDARQRLRLLDQHLEADPAFEAELRLELRSSVSTNHTSRGAFTFGTMMMSRLRAGARHHLDDVVVGPDRVHRVDAHGADFAAPVEDVQRIDDRARVHAPSAPARRRPRGRGIRGRRPHAAAFSIIFCCDPGVASSERRSRAVMRPSSSPCVRGGSPASASTSSVCSPSSGGRR